MSVSIRWSGKRLRDLEIVGTPIPREEEDVESYSWMKNTHTFSVQLSALRIENKVWLRGTVRDKPNNQHKTKSLRRIIAETYEVTHFYLLKNKSS